MLEISGGIVSKTVEELLTALEEKKLQLKRASKEASRWDASRYKTSGHVQTSRKYVISLQKEIKCIESEIAILKDI